MLAVAKITHMWSVVVFSRQDVIVVITGNSQCLRDVRLLALQLHSLEELGCGVGTLTPEETQAREMQHQKRQARDDVSAVDVITKLVLALKRHSILSD